MNCRHVQDVLCPYVDGRLSGERMLEIRRHLDNCRTCADEFLSISEGRMLLRMLPTHSPSIRSEQLLADRLSIPASRTFQLTLVAQLRMGVEGVAWASAWQTMDPPPGRRFAKALVMSCLGSLVIAGPFGSATQNIAALRSLKMDIWSRLGQKFDQFDPHNILGGPSIASNYGSDVERWQNSPLQRQAQPVSWRAGDRVEASLEPLGNGISVFTAEPISSAGAVSSFASFQNP